MLQLNPPLPMNLIGGAGWIGPTGAGIAHFAIDTSVEHNIVWIIALDATGQIWCVQNRYVRMQKNFTLGRNNPEK